MNDLMTLITALEAERQPFVVTTEYITPQRHADREKDDTEGGLKLDVIEKAGNDIIGN
jgi:hypothetical protein